MLRSFVCVLTVVALLGGGQAYAGHLIQGGVNLLEDDDFESFVVDHDPFDTDGDLNTSESNGKIDVGDRFLGVFRVQTLNGVVKGPGDPTVTAVFYLEAIKVLDTDASGGIDRIFFGAASSGGANDAIAQWAALDPSMPTLMSDDTMAIMFEHPDIDATDEGAGSDIFDSLDTFDDSFAGASKLAEFGFNAGDADTDGITDDGEFWVTTGPDGIDDPTNIAIFLASPFIADPTNALNINLTHNYTAPGLLKHNQVLPFNAAAHLQGVGTFVPLGAQPPGNWGLSTDTDLVLMAVPEPVSVLAWSAFAGLGVIGGLRRSRKR